jgi:ABC-type multidrug transport system fused ATPase/permease subunit
MTDNNLDIMKGVTAFNTIQNTVKSIEMGGQKTAMETKLDISHSTDIPVIEFRKAKFSYPERPDRTVLRGLDLQVSLLSS